MSKTHFTKPNLINAAVTEKQLQEQHDPHYQRIAERTKDIDCKQFVELVDSINPHPEPRYPNIPTWPRYKRLHGRK